MRIRYREPVLALVGIYAVHFLITRVAVATATRRVPALQALAVSLAVAISHFYEVMLFSNRFGEP